MFQFSKNLFLQLRQNYSTDYRLFVLYRNIELRQAAAITTLKTNQISKKNKSWNNKKIKK